MRLVPRDVCDECEAFVGREHQADCSKSGIVTEAEAVEKFTSLDHVEEVEGPMLGMPVDAIELLLRCMIPPEVAGDDAENLAKLRDAFEGFLVFARTEAGA